MTPTVTAKEAYGLARQRIRLARWSLSCGWPNMAAEDVELARKWRDLARAARRTEHDAAARAGGGGSDEHRS